MDIRVSYVVATKNRAPFVRAALPLWASVKGPQDELVVVDGGSTDGTYECLRDAPAGLVDQLVHEPDRSEAHAINKGFLLARGRYLKTLTDDDIYFPEALSKAYQVLDEHLEIDVLVGGGESVDKALDPANQRPHFFQWYPDGINLAGDCAFVTMNGLGAIIRRRSLAVTGLLDPRHLHADTSFFTQATVRGACIRYLRLKVYRHQVGRQSLSFAHNMRKTYIYRDFNFRRLSRWRYLKQPGRALEILAQRIGLLKPTLPEPVWDGKLM
jgi:glycosyltransferase involved in cell wall biosynthesis